MKVAVAGGTGVAGRWAADALRADGHEAIVIARSAGTDLVTGDGLEAVLAGVDAVIDATNVASSGKRASSEFFEATACLPAGTRAPAPGMADASVMVMTWSAPQLGDRLATMADAIAATLKLTPG